MAWDSGKGCDEEMWALLEEMRAQNAKLLDENHQLKCQSEEFTAIQKEYYWTDRSR